MDAREAQARVNWKFCSTEGVCLGDRKSYCARPSVYVRGYRCMRLYSFPL